MAYVTIPRKDLKLVKQIGSGGFGSVYKGLWKSREVAAKRLNEPDRNEVEFLSQLQHRHIVNLFGVIDEEFEFFLILELCEGGSLRSFLNEHKGERLKQFYDWVNQAGSPIEYLHEMKIIHKDVKSSNYLITKGNVLKLADFGLAKRTDVTMTATASASYAFMAPELMTEDKLSPTYDIFAFMVVVWELWTTQIPFEGSEPEVVMYKVCALDERLQIPPDLPKPLADLMKQAWDKDRTKRPTINHILAVVRYSIVNSYCRLPYLL